MKKKTEITDTLESSLETQHKESFKQRLMTLIGDRSVRAAAKSWGLSYSTLNNYLSRGTIPALNVAHEIANIEGVSLEWLANGSSSTVQSSADKMKSVRHHHFDASGWLDMLEVLTEEERNEALRVIKRHGVDLLLNIVDQDNIELMKLSPTRKKLALVLRNLSEDRVREILAGDAPSTVTSTVNIANSKG